MSSDIHLNFNRISNGQIQKIISCPHFYCFRIRVPGETIFLYLGKGRISCSLFLSAEKISSEYRRKDNFLEKLRKDFLNSRILGLSSKNNFICLTTKRAGLKSWLNFTYRGSLLFINFLKQTSGGIREFSLYKKNQYQNIITDKFNIEDFLEEENKLIPKGKPIGLVLGNNESKSVEIYQKKLESIERNAQKSRNRKVNSINSDINRLREFLLIKDSLIKQESLSKYIKRDYFLYKGIKVRAKGLSYFALRDKIFLKLKNIKMAIKIQEDRLLKLESDNLKKEVKIKNILPVTRKIERFDKSSKNKFKPQPFGEGELILIGKSAVENDKIRRNWCLKTDYWFHLKDFPSAHVFLRLKDQKSSLTPEILNRICDYFFEEMKNLSEVKIVYTQIKNIRSVKGKIGSVTMQSYREFLKRY